MGKCQCEFIFFFFSGGKKRKGSSACMWLRDYFTILSLSVVNLLYSLGETMTVRIKGIVKSFLGLEQR